MYNTTHHNKENTMFFPANVKIVSITNRNTVTYFRTLVCFDGIDIVLLGHKESPNKHNIIYQSTNQTIKYTND